MKRVCAWCNTVLQEGSTEEGTTHGMCDSCFEQVIEEEHDLRTSSEQLVLR